MIVIKENIKEKKIESKLKNVKLKLSSCIKLCNPNKETAPKVGIDNKKEIFAESYLLKFKILAVVIVIPDRLTPGIKDNIWQTPIIIADL